MSSGLIVPSDDIGIGTGWADGGVNAGELTGVSTGVVCAGSEGAEGAGVGISSPPLLLM